MPLVPWEPFAELERVRRDLGRLFNMAPGRGLEEAPWRPSVDVLEEDDEIVFRVEVPGLDPKDIDVRVDDQTVTIRGETKEEKRINGDGYYHRERRYGHFFRSIPLPVRVKASQARASYRHGLLEIRVPREEEDAGRGRRIQVEEV